MKEYKRFLENNLNLPIKTIIVEETSSTNDLCKELALSEKNDILIIALSQSAGKGRLSRSFFSPIGSGIYISLLLHPILSPSDCIKITTAAAVAAAEAIDIISGQESLIKWVNDIYLYNKKVCGILTESAFSGSSKPDFAVLGIGVNLFSPKEGFPSDIKDKAGSIFKTTLPDYKKAVEFIKEFIGRFFKIYNNLPNTEYMNKYRKRSFITGKEVHFIKDGNEILGIAKAINDSAELIVETENGEISLSAGEVSLKL